MALYTKRLTVSLLVISLSLIMLMVFKDNLKPLLVENRNSQLSPAEPSPTYQLSSFRNAVHWKPDWYSQDDIGVLLNNRREAILSKCKQLPSYNSTWKYVTPELIVRSKTLSVTMTAKGGSTFWKGVLRALKKLETKTIEPRVKIALIRNPWHRLVSAWNDKFVAANHHKCTGKRWNRVPEFSEFVEACVIGYWKRGFSNRHWDPVFDRDHICRTNYDFYISTENTNKEAEYILQNWSGIPNAKDFLDKLKDQRLRPHEKKNSTRNYQDQYRNVSMENMALLRELYKHDIFLFGYPDTPFIEFDGA